MEFKLLKENDTTLLRKCDSNHEFENGDRKENLNNKLKINSKSKDKLYNVNNGKKQS